MIQPNCKAKEISLGEDFGDVAVKVNGVYVKVSTDGSILAYTNGAVKVCPVANDDGKTATGAEPKIGAVMPDGTIFAGISPDTSKPMYATPADAPLTMKFNEAAAYAKKLNAEKYLGHDDWRVPTKDELNVLFNNRAAVGGFNVHGSDAAGWYWSGWSPNDGWRAWIQRFSDGCQYRNPEDSHSSVRCVR
jgi:hypothetical protein